MTKRGYWLDLFTGTTWKEFTEAGGSISGFPESRWKTVQQVRVGDYLLCYLTGISRFIGVLEVVKAPYKATYRDATKLIWKDDLFPCRLGVKPLEFLTPETAVPILDLRDRLSIFDPEKGPTSWTGYVRPTTNASRFFSRTLCSRVSTFTGAELCRRESEAMLWTQMLEADSFACLFRSCWAACADCTMRVESPRKTPAEMTLFSYIVTSDTGFSPNPFFGYCTLACCKPEIRRRAQKGDWIVGLTPKALGHKIVYFMQVDEVVDFRRYWNDKRFRQKRPRYDKDVRLRCGDNIYQPLSNAKPLSNGNFRQLRSRHSNGDSEDPEKKTIDLRGEHVLISETFAYYGSKAIPLPSRLSALKVGRGHRSRFTPEVLAEFHCFVASRKLGVHAFPTKWPKDDRSWKSSACGSK